MVRSRFGFAALILAAILGATHASQGEEALLATSQQSDSLSPDGAAPANTWSPTIHEAAWSTTCPSSESCGCPNCAKQQEFEKKATQAYQDLFYNNSFDYIEDPDYCGWHLGESLKRRTIGDWATIDVGGQYRIRQQSERAIRYTAEVPNFFGLTGRDDDFLLHRTRLFANAEVGDRVRFFGEMLDARCELADYPARGIEANRTDIQNLFLDVVAVDGDRGKLIGRVGRQEVSYGVQRLVSPLDWANTRRTFEGGRLMWQGENWDVDGLWVRPLRRYIDALDPPHLDRQLYGVYTTYKGMTRDKVELYWLALDYDDVGVRYDTIASRYYGSQGVVLYEFEGGVQFGENPDDSGHSAGFFTLGLGHKRDKLPAKPTLWAYYDWASGDDTVRNGFHHYEPLSHRYLGFMDLYGRRNIEDANVQLTLQPHERVTLLAWYHFFWLQNTHDVPYNVDMSPFAGLTANSSGSRELGQELDLTATLVMSPRTNALLGYSHFFSGEYYDTTPGVPYAGDADFFYTQFTVNF